MLSYLLKFRKNAESKNPDKKTINEKAMLLPRCAVCGGKKSKSIKEQDTSVLRSARD